LKRAAAALGWLLVVCPVRAQTLELRFFDVGQGDAALIVAPEGKSVLVDAGPGAWPVVPYLQSHHYDTLDLIVASHNHPITSAGWRTCSPRGWCAPTSTTAFPIPPPRTNARCAQVEASGRNTSALGSARLRVLVPPSRPVDQNNGSVGILLEYGALIIEAKRDGSYIVLNEYSRPARDHE